MRVCVPAGAGVGAPVGICICISTGAGSGALAGICIPTAARAGTAPGGAAAEVERPAGGGAVTIASGFISNSYVTLLGFLLCALYLCCFKPPAVAEEPWHPG